MKLYLVRHGEALSPSLDPMQPLSSKGRDEVEKVARFLVKSHIQLTTIFHSPKLRAKQTAELIASHVAPHLSLLEKEGLSPNDPVQPFVKELEKMQGPTLVAGHLPFIASLIGSLLFNAEMPPFIQLTSGSIACLERIENQWIIDWLISPDIL